MMEDGRPAELAPYIWWAKGEQRGCQTTEVEAGAGGWAGICEPPGFQGCTQSFSEQDVETGALSALDGGQEPSLS